MENSEKRAEAHMVKGIYRVGGADITDSRDCNVYLIDADAPVLVDSGFGAGLDRMIENIASSGVDPGSIESIILTHCHIDHIGAADRLRNRFGARLLMHELDAAIVERGDNLLTAAFCFEVDFEPLSIDVKVSGTEGILPITGEEIRFLHTPGHTPGSISPYLDHNGTRVLFGQDLGAPLLSEFDCDTTAWRLSMTRLLALKADVLCDGHSGIYQPASRVAAYIKHFIKAYGPCGTD
jgi:glyoxylase-like metal-dependent hydrolase (beta-lactamase superfamily II)